MNTFERLKAWQACHRLAVDVSSAAVTDGSSATGPLQLLQQAAVDAALQVALGSTAQAPGFVYRLGRAVDALTRAAYFIHLARDLRALSPETAGRFEIERDHARQLTWALRCSVSRRKTGDGNKKRE